MTVDPQSLSLDPQSLSLPDALARARRLIATDPALALAQLREVLTVAPHSSEGHRLTALALRRLGRIGEAQDADLEAVRTAVHDPQMLAAAQALLANELHVAEPILKGRLKSDPTDCAAIRMLAELAARIGRLPDAENLLRRALELAPGFGAARANLATVLYKQNRYGEAVEQLDKILSEEPDNAAHRNLKAAALGRIGGYDEAIALYAELIDRFPDHAKLHMSHGHILKTVGRQEDSIAAYRQALRVQPGLGEVWWSLANLKTVRFDVADVAAMEAALDDADITVEDRFHLHFALGKAAEDAQDWARSFEYYAQGNALRRAQIDYDADDTSRHVARSIAAFTPALLTARAGQGHGAPDPIFILGMPRAGSTLIEQILSSHSMVEGTMELPDMPAIAMREARSVDDGPGSWIAAITQATPDRLAQLGAEYLERTRIQRKTDKPFFIDKLPNNWLYTGLIHLILPQAKIIDARRHPMDCGFSNFKQHFAQGQAFSYALEDMGRYYADYVALMRHFDAVLPGRVHRVIHEALVDDPETEVRRLLDHLGLPFEDACLRFHENARAVRTASSEQVRRPINREGMDRWRHYAAWLAPLEQALGPVLTAYPAVPAD
ncbi:tetratricopeptide repeat-containing sulfotransferase family protein [Sphingobium algorifonticola]|uniref:Sulfotransferase family protein n=1 Tax=Sphingobium algorifonticola TaxID=2008318 RepID=A0A437JCK0_9SPHN|nr:tetratricopeptide repeat-containing sulfotransferase family protein [Sphingobium algorifonticola]RVT43621.1 sulfotransferase family protein [Sphingobium algorifonticola]